MYIAFVRHRKCYGQIPRSGSYSQVKEFGEPGSYLPPSYLAISMSQRVQLLSLEPNITHNFITTQFINYSITYMLYRNLTLVHSYHEFLKCSSVGIDNMLPASALNQYFNTEYNNYHHNLQKNGTISTSYKSSVSTLSSPSIASTNNEGFSLFSPIHEKIWYQD